MAIAAGQVLTDLAAADPDRPAITCGEHTVTRAGLESWSNRLARAYQDLGVREGSFVTIALPNSAEFYAAIGAAWKLGAVPQPVSHRLPDRERRAIIDLADSALVVGVEPGTHGERACLPAGFTPDPDISDAPFDDVRVSPAFKAPTSGGSTGRPKLIVSGQTGAFEPASATRMFGMRENGVQLVPGPLYHNAPFTVSTYGLLIGQHLVVLPKFDPVAALAAIDRYEVDWVNLVPTMMLRMWRALEAEPGRYDLSSLDRVWHMAAPCPAWLKEAWIGLVGPETLYELYAGTEAQAVTVITGTEWLEHRGSVGRPLIGEMKILDSDGNELPPGEVGEIYMRSPVGAPPSYRYIGAEAKVRGGWESLGDLGWVDADGYVYISDRLTDMILSGGANIYPAEVESAVMEHPDVETCVVVGLPDEDLGQRVHAVVQAKGPLGEDALREFLSERLVRYKLPRTFRFVDEPLRGDDGKVRRSALRDHEAELAKG